METIQLNKKTQIIRPTNRDTTAASLKPDILPTTVIVTAATYYETSSKYEKVILCNATLNPIIVYIPTAVDNNATLIIKKVDSSSNTVTITPTGAETIDSAASKILVLKDEASILRPDNTNWKIISSNFKFTNLIPSSNSLYDLGSSSYKWNNFYITNIATNLIPNIDGSLPGGLDLGSSGSKWKTLYITNIGTSLIPNLATLDLGSLANLWRTLYITNIGTSLIPNAGNLDLGTLTNPWRDLYLAGNTIYLGSTGRLSYSDSTNTFSFKKSLTLAAKINFSDVGLIDNTSSNAVTLKAPTGLVASYNVTMPAALPGSTLPVQMDTSGNLLLQAIQGVPTGVMADFAGNSAPTGWLLCDGSAILRIGTYGSLFAVIGTTYGIGDGSTTFNVPDYRGRLAIGAGTGLGLTNRVLGVAGGNEVKNETHLHKWYTTAGASADHTSFNSGGSAVAFDSSVSQSSGHSPIIANGGGHTTSGIDMYTNIGGSSTQDVMNPYLPANKIIKY